MERGRGGARTAAVGLLAGLGVLLSAGSAAGAFPGRNGDIAMARELKTKSGDRIARIVLMDPHGKNVRQLPSPDAKSYEVPLDFSADGRTLLFTAKAAFFVMRVDGTHRRRIPNASGHLGARLAPGGRRIVFTNAFDGHVTLIDVDGRHRRELPYRGESPAFSPDGRRIAFTLVNESAPQDRQIYVVNADGTHLRQLTFHNSEGFGENNSTPDWSPDGREIAFDSTRGGGSGIYVMKADGSKLRRLTNIDPGPGTHPTTVRSDIDTHAIFSPNGSKIVFSRVFQDDNGDHWQTWLMNADGSRQHRLSIGGLGDHGAVWAPIPR